MTKFKENKDNSFGIIQKQPNGVISQIGLTESQYKLFEIFLSGLGPLYRLPIEYNMQIVKENCKTCDRSFEDCIC